MARRLALALLTLATLLAGGCAVTQDQRTRVPERIETDPATGGRYWIFVPDTYDPRRPIPLIVSCHGSVPFDVANHHVRELKKLAEKHTCIVLAPELAGTDGIIGDGPVAAQIANENTILSLVSMAGYRYNIDTANILLTGFSGGGFPVYWIALRNPGVFRCVALRSCNFSQPHLDGWFSPGAAGRQEFLVYWGEQDPGPIRQQSTNGLQFLQSRGYSVADQVIPRLGHERRPDVAMDFFLAHLRPPKPSQP